jgi:4'-phosphopantetheinyl transferase
MIVTDGAGSTISASGITTWMVPVDAIPEALWPRLNGLLSEPEREQASRFRFARDARHYQAAHALKRLMLSAATGDLAPQAWVFETGPLGKPHVARRAGPHFNLSHCAGLVACAVSWSVEPGIDVESLDRAAPLELAAQYFAPVEHAWLEAQPAADRSTAFLQLWTLKEACSKAIGLGLTLPLDGVIFGFDPLRIASADPALGDPALWRLDQRLVEGRHVLALAWRMTGRGLVPDIVSVRLEALLEGGAGHP